MIFGILTNSAIPDPGMKIIVLFAYILALLTAIIPHELAHGYVAYKNGDLTAKFAGRLSLNPIKHFDLMGFLMLAIVGFGWAKPVPIDSRNFTNYKKGMTLVSLAGVTMNLILAIVFSILLLLLSLLISAISGAIESSLFLFYLLLFLKYYFLYAIVINLTLMAFNILPIYPLDGFRLVETYAKPGNRYVQFMYKYGSFVLLGLLLGGNILGNISPWLDPLGLYINAVTNGMMKLFELIIGVRIF